MPWRLDTERLDYLGQRKNGTYDDELRKRPIRELEARIPLGRFTTVRDVAETVAFLASDAAEHITGQRISVAGETIMH